jgi:hypothetical protein
MDTVVLGIQSRNSIILIIFIHKLFFLEVPSDVCERLPAITYYRNNDLQSSVTHWSRSASTHTPQAIIQRYLYHRQTSATLFPHAGFSSSLLLAPVLGLDWCPAPDLFCRWFLEMMFWDPALIKCRLCASSDHYPISGRSISRYSSLASRISLLSAP